MTKFLNKSFSVGMAGNQQYRDNWDVIFGKKRETFFERHIRCSWMGRGLICKHASDCEHGLEHACQCEHKGCDDCKWPELK